MIIPNIWEKKKHGNQTTNQKCIAVAMVSDSEKYYVILCHHVTVPLPGQIGNEMLLDPHPKPSGSIWLENLRLPQKAPTPNI